MSCPGDNLQAYLRNQVYFLTEGDDQEFAETLGISSLKETLATAQKAFFLWTRKHRWNAMIRGQD